MKLKKVQSIHKGQLEVQEVSLETPEGTLVTKERTKREPHVVAICHDVINDLVMLVNTYRVGAMKTMLEFPEGPVRDFETSLAAIERNVIELTGIQVKSSQNLQEYMENPDSQYAPTTLFYCTFDSRDAVEGDVELIPGRELIKQVENGEHDSVGVILGAQYLKLLRNRLVK